MAYIRTVQTASHAIAVQIVHSNRRRSRDRAHRIGAHSGGGGGVDGGSSQRLHAGQYSFDFGDGRPAGATLPILSSRSQLLSDALGLADARFGLDATCGQDEVFPALVLARLIEPTSKLDTIRVLEEIGIVAPSCPTINRRLPVCASVEWRQQLARTCAAHVGLGPATLVIYDVTTLYFETDQCGGFREPDFSKERRLAPQIAAGLLTDARDSC